MRVIYTAAVILLVLGAARGQEQPPPPTLIFATFDEYSADIPVTHQWARLDNLANYLKSNPDAVAHLYVYAGRRSCAGEAQARAVRARNYVVRQGVGPGRVFWKDAGYREVSTVQMWVVPRGATEPRAEPHYEPSEVKVLRGCRPKRRGSGGRRHARAAHNNAIQPTAK